MLGDDFVTGIRVKNVKSEEETDLAVDGFFLAIGHTPMTDIVKGQLDLHDNGYIKVEPGTTTTSVPGVFAAGDCQDWVYRQAVTAALEAERWLAATDD